MEKIGVSTAVGLVIYAYTNGLVVPRNYEIVYNKNS